MNAFFSMYLESVYRILYRHYNPRLVYFYPIFDYFIVIKEDFSENSGLMYG